MEPKPLLFLITNLLLSTQQFLIWELGRWGGGDQHPLLCVLIKVPEAWEGGRVEPSSGTQNWPQGLKSPDSGHLAEEGQRSGPKGLDSAGAGGAGRQHLERLAQSESSIDTLEPRRLQLLLSPSVVSSSL